MGAVRKNFEELLELIRRAARFNYAAELLEWDSQTKMPGGGVEGRAEIYAAVKTEGFRLFTSDEVGEALERLVGKKEPSLLDSLLENSADKEEELSLDEQALVKRMWDVYDRARAIPLDLYQAFSETTSRAHSIWVEAKEKSDFGLFRPVLTQIVDFSRQFAELYGYKENPYDGLLPDYEPGMTTAALREIIEPLHQELVPFVQLLAERPQPDEKLLQGNFPKGRQRMLSEQVLGAMGYDFNRGRLDTTEHPFTTSVGPDDVRVTTHFIIGDLLAALSSTIHEAGHALYEQGQHPLSRWLYLGKGYSLGLHESQSRLWENTVGKSYDFWRFFYPTLRDIFHRFKEIDLWNFYRAINIVKPSLIRIYADEVTYILHIMLRFEIEEALLNRKIEVKDLPEIWKEKMKEYLGIVPENDRESVLQDVHWSFGYIGYFPTYMLGSLYAAQLFAAAQREIPELGEEIAKGNLRILLDWLRKNVHPFGMVYEAPELLQEVTGEGPNSQYWLDYVKEKFSTIYELP